MKRIAFMFAVCCLALVACNKEEPAPDPSGSVPENLFVQMGEQGGTKSYFTPTSENKVYVHSFNEADDISVFWESSENLMYRANNINKSSGYSDFKITGYSYGSATPALNGRYAMYPFSKDNSVTEDANKKPTFTYCIPATQTYRQVNSAGTFGTASYDNGADSKTMGCAVYIAKNKASSKGNNYFDFYNVGCWMRLDLKVKDGESLSVGKLVLSNEAVALCGTATEIGDPNNLGSATKDNFTYPTKTADNCSITIPCSTAVALDKTTAQSFYFYFLPIGLKDGFDDGTHKGFNIKVYDESNNLRAVLTSSITKTGTVNPGTASETTVDLFKRNQVVNLAPVTIESSKIQYTVEVASWGDGGSTDINLE